MSNEEISDFDVAILDSIKTIIEVLASNKIAPISDFSVAFSHQRDEAFQNQNAKGTAVFQMLLEFCNDPQRAQMRTLSEQSPQGNA